jgi:hypothetical protein
VRDLGALCGAADRVLELVAARLPKVAPNIRDWNDRLFVEAFARAYNCLGSIRVLAERRAAEDAAVLTRALVSLTLQYLWLICPDEEEERRNRLRRLERKWASERATLGEELTDLGYLPRDADAEELQQQVAEFRERADTLKAESVPSMLGERDMAIALDRELELEVPRFFELVYARSSRTTSHVAHFGIGAALGGFVDPPEDPGALSLDRADEDDAAEALGLALVTFGVLVDIGEPVLRSGLAEEIAELIRASHADESPTE